MRRYGSGLLATLLLLVMTACGDPEPAAIENDLGQPAAVEPQEAPAAQTDTGGEVDLEAVLSGEITDVVYGQLDEETKQQLIAAAQAEGGEVTFNPDGSMTVVDADGSVVVQNPDGSWVVEDEDGTVGQISGGWPDNEFTRQVPTPTIEVLMTTVGEDTMTIAFGTATVEQARSYAEQLRNAGFVLDETVTDEEYSGIALYTFSARNGSGYWVELTWTVGSAAMIVRR